MKIFYSIEDNFPPYRVDIVELFAKTLPKYGLSVDWYMRQPKPASSEEAEFLGQKVYLPFRPKLNNSIGKILTKLSFWGCDIWQLFRCLLRPIDVIQVRDKYIAAMIGLFVARIKRIPFIYWCSYPFPEHYQILAQQSGGVKSLYCYIHSQLGKLVLYRFVMKLADHVFVQTEFMKSHYADTYRVLPNKMTPVPMGVPQQLLTWAKDKKTPVVSNRVVYLGTMASVRQLHMLIDAFAKVYAVFPQATFMMVGDGDHPHERAALEHQAQALGIDHVVKFTGFLPIEQAWSYAASGQVCVSPIFPSLVLKCGSPTKLFEYMALGRPVVSNHHPDQTSIIAESGAGLCVDWSSEAFADAMIWMLNHPREAELMGEKGATWVEMNRTYPILADLVWRKYQEVLQA